MKQWFIKGEELQNNDRVFLEGEYRHVENISHSARFVSFTYNEWVDGIANEIICSRAINKDFRFDIQRPLTVLTLIETSVICSHFLCALFNGDISGMNDDDITSLEKWEAQYNAPTYDVQGDEVEQDETDFSRCEITGLMGDCVTVDIHEQRPNTGL